LPVPVAPDLMLIQFALSVAVHGQPSPAVTVTLPLVPRAENDRSPGVTT
jgi:hypothetical protein